MDRKLTKFDILIPFSNIHKNYHIREIARIFNVHHAVASKLLKLLLKESILRRDVKGREQIYSLNFGNSLTIKYLSICEDIKLFDFIKNRTDIEKSLFLDLINLLINFYPKDILLSLIFGSYAKGYETEKSDIDIMIILRVDKREGLNKAINNIGKKWGKKISILYLTINDFENNLKEKNKMLIDIIENHIILVGSEEYTAMVIE